MPTVPQYGGAPRVQQSAGPANLGQDTTRATAENFSSFDAGQVGQAASGLILKAKSDADQVAVLDADNKLSKLETELLYDPKAGAFSKKGKDAFGSVETVNADFDKQISSIEEGLSNAEQKAAFRARYEQRKESVNKQLNQHVAGEISRYDDENTQASLGNDKNLAVANPGLNLSGSLKRQEETIMQWASRKGVSAEVAKLKVQENASATNMAVLQKLLGDGDDLGAEAFFKRNPDAFVGDDRLRAEKFVAESTLLGKGQRNGDEIFQTSRTMTEGLAKIREIENPKERKATEEQFLHLHQQKKMADQDRVESINKQAVAFINSGQGTGADFIKRYGGGLNTGESTQILNYKMGGPTQTDQKTWYALKTLAGNPATHDAFMKADLTQYLDKLTGSDFQEVSKWQDEARKGDKRTLRGLQKEVSIVNRQLNEMGFNDAQRKADSDNPGVMAFRDSVEEWKQDFQDQHKRQPSNLELTDAVKKLSYEVVTQKNTFWFDKKKRVYELSDEDVAKIKVTDIPPEKRSEIREALKRAGKSLTPENERELWVKKLKAGRNISAN